MNLIQLPIDILIEIYKNTLINKNGTVYISSANLLKTCRFFAFEIEKPTYRLFKFEANRNAIISDLQNNKIGHWNDETQLRCTHCSCLLRSDGKKCCHIFNHQAPL